MYYIAVKYLNEPLYHAMSEEYIPLIYPPEDTVIKWLDVSKRVSIDFHRRLQKIINSLVAQGVYNMLSEAGISLNLKPVKYKVVYLDDGGVEIRILMEVK